MPAEFVASDTGSKIKVTCKRKDGSLIDLQGKTVKVKWRIDDGALVEKTMTNLAPTTAAQAEYQFTAGELKAGTMKGEFMIVEGASETTSIESFSLPIRSRV